MPWDNSVNKRAQICAVVTTTLVEQFPLSKTVEWAALMASLSQTGIYKFIDDFPSYTPWKPDIWHIQYCHILQIIGNTAIVKFFQKSIHNQWA